MPEGLLESLGIAYVTTPAPLICLMRQKRISLSETLQHLEKIRAFISSEEYLISLEALRPED